MAPPLPAALGSSSALSRPLALSLARWDSGFHSFMYAGMTNALGLLTLPCLVCVLADSPSSPEAEPPSSCTGLSGGKAPGMRDLRPDLDAGTRSAPPYFRKLGRCFAPAASVVRDCSAVGGTAAAAVEEGAGATAGSVEGVESGSGERLRPRLRVREKLKTIVSSSSSAAVLDAADGAAARRAERRVFRADPVELFAFTLLLLSGRRVEGAGAQISTFSPRAAAATGWSVALARACTPCSFTASSSAFIHVPSPQCVRPS